MSDSLTLTTISGILIMCSGFLKRYLLRSREIDNRLRISLEHADKVLDALSRVYEIAVGREFPTLAEVQECREYQVPGQNENGIEIIRARFALKVARAVAKGEAVEDPEIQEAIAIMEDLGQTYRAAAFRVMDDEE